MFIGSAPDVKISILREGYQFQSVSRNVIRVYGSNKITFFWILFHFFVFESVSDYLTIFLSLF